MLRFIARRLALALITLLLLSAIVFAISNALKNGPAAWFCSEVARPSQKKPPVGVPSDSNRDAVAGKGF